MIPIFAISLVLLSGSISAAHAISIVQNNDPMDLFNEISAVLEPASIIPSISLNPKKSK